MPRWGEYTTFPFSFRRLLPLGATGASLTFSDDPSAGLGEFPLGAADSFAAFAERLGGAFFGFRGGTVLADDWGRTEDDGAPVWVTFPAAGDSLSIAYRK